MTVYKPIELETAASANATIVLLYNENISALTSDTISNGQTDVPYIKLSAIA